MRQLSLLAQNWQLFDVEIRSRPNPKTVLANPSGIKTYFRLTITYGITSQPLKIDQTI